MEILFIFGKMCDVDMSCSIGSVMELFGKVMGGFRTWVGEANFVCGKINLLNELTSILNSVS